MNTQRLIALGLCLAGTGLWLPGPAARADPPAEPTADRADTQARAETRVVMPRFDLTVEENDVFSADDVDLVLQSHYITQYVNYDETANDRHARAQLVLGCGLKLRVDDPRLVLAHLRWSAAALTDAHGDPVDFTPQGPPVEIQRELPLSLKPNWEQIKANALRTGAGLDTDTRLGPVIGSLTLETTWHIAEQVIAVDLPLPGDAYDARRDRDAKGAAFEPIELIKGTTAELRAYNKSEAEYVIRTDDPQVFAAKRTIEDDKPLAMMYLGAMAMSGDEALRPTTTMPIAFHKLEDADGVWRGTLRLRVYAHGRTRPDALRLYLAKNVRPVRLTATLKDIRLNAAVNTDAPDEPADEADR